MRGVCTGGRVLTDLVFWIMLLPCSFPPSLTTVRFVTVIVYVVRPPGPRLTVVFVSLLDVSGCPLLRS